MCALHAAGDGPSGVILRRKWLCSLALAFGLLSMVFAQAQEQNNPAPANTAAGDTKAPLPQRVRVSSRVMGELIIKKVAPRYPEEARRAHIQGTVLLQVLINKNGIVEDVQLISGHPELTEAAIKAVKKWKYKPYLLQGEPAEVETIIQVNFSLSYE